MRYRSAALLTLFALSAAAQTAADQFRSVEGPLSVSLRDSHNAHAEALHAMQAEVEALFVPAAIRVHWQSPGKSEVVSRLAVIRFSGNCDANAAIPASLRFAARDADALGQTQVVDGHVLPIAEIRCDAVRQFIANDLKATPAAARNEVLGRALGRVVAHELYHVLLRTRHHGREGLARPAQSSAELVAVRTSFARQDELKLAESVPADFDASSSGR
jgi:hypothetical protein